MVRIEIFSDVVCPWCFVGHQRLSRVAAELGEKPALRYRPFYLQPNTPEAGVDIPNMLKKKYGVEPSRMFAMVEAAARESELTLDLTKQRFMYPTVRAHTLLRHAERKGTQPALVRALFEAYFQDAKNIADVDELVRVAGAHGFEAAEVREILADADELSVTDAVASEAARGGIRGVPYYVFNDKVGLSGAQPESVFREAFRKAKAI
jgi:predicted DsbA family dithiol-disulfide isomerase